MDAVPAAEERSPSHVFNSSDYSCEICLTNYNESSRLPKILQCGHTFCLECTFQLGPGDDISCPLCRIITYLGWDDELPTNFSFLNILQKMNLLCTEPPPSDINTADYSQDFEEDPLDPDSYVPNAQIWVCCGMTADDLLFCSLLMLCVLVGASLFFLFCKTL